MGLSGSVVEWKEGHSQDNEGGFLWVLGVEEEEMRFDVGRSWE